ncbi:MAG: hypothetical protein AB1505_05825 [Candidatus Latescibacterota bacterium]
MLVVRSAEEEARSLLQVHGDLLHCQQVIVHQFDVIQARTQSLLALATLALTITGFSGPRIAASSSFSRWTMVLGLACVLVSLAIGLVGAMRIRWLTQVSAPTAEETVAAMIAYRDRKTRAFRHALVSLVAGLIFYVGSVIGYMLTGLWRPPHSALWRQAA